MQTVEELPKTSFVPQNSLFEKYTKSYDNSIEIYSLNQTAQECSATETSCWVVPTTRFRYGLSIYSFISITPEPPVPNHLLF